MDIRTIRLNNLETLVKEAGSMAELGRRAEVNDMYIGQIRRGVAGKGRNRSRGIGDDVARKLEKGMKKPFGWMDHNHGTSEGKASIDAGLETPDATLQAPRVADLQAEYAARQWPFSAALLGRVMSLDIYQRGIIEGKLRVAVEECEHENLQAAKSGKR